MMLPLKSLYIYNEQLYTYFHIYNSINKYLILHRHRHIYIYKYESIHNKNICLHNIKDISKEAINLALSKLISDKETK